MLKHIVMWKLKEFAEGKTKAENALITAKKFEKAGLSSISRNKKRVKYIDTFQVKERKTGLEPATPTLGRSCSTN